MKAKNAVVGQRVELKVNRDGLKAGATGTIVRLVKTTPPIGVQWDTLTSGHNCNGATTTDGSGWYVDSDQIRKLKEEPKPKEIVVGSRVRRNDRDNRGDSTSIRVGDIGVVTEVNSDVYRIKFEQYGEASLYKHKVDLVK